MCFSRIYICIGYIDILPTIWEYMPVDFIYWCWIYSANNWSIYVSWRVSVRPSGAGLGNVHFLKNKFVLDIYLRGAFRKKNSGLVGILSQLFIKIDQNLICLETVHKCWDFVAMWRRFPSSNQKITKNDITNDIKITNHQK